MNFKEIKRKPAVGNFFYLVDKETKDVKRAVVEGVSGSEIQYLMPDTMDDGHVNMNSEECQPVDLTHDILLAMGYDGHYNVFTYDICHQKVFADYVVTLDLSTARVWDIKNQTLVVNMWCTSLHELQQIYDFVGISQEGVSEAFMKVNPNENKHPMLHTEDGDCDLRYPPARPRCSAEMNDDIEMCHIAEGVGSKSE